MINFLKQFTGVQPNVIKQQARQGDVFLEVVKKSELPEFEDKKYTTIEGGGIPQGVVLAHGEVTGHMHAVRSPNAFLMKQKDSNQFYLFIAGNLALDLVHEEHSPITLPPGHYKVTKQRQYTPGRIINVAD